MLVLLLVGTAGMKQLHDIAASWAVRHVPNELAKRSQFPPALAPSLDCYVRARDRISRWPEYAETPLRSAPAIAASLGIAELWLKDESNRLTTGSFKALGGGYAVDEVLSNGCDQVIATASAGNHGIGVAWACQRLHAECHVFLSTRVSELQAEKIRNLGGMVHRHGDTYEDSLEEARRVSEASGWQIVQDVSWEGYARIPALIFAGYTVLAGEMVGQLAAAGAERPTHVLINTGVGGLCAAVCAHLWARYGEARPTLIAVEPTAADCNLHSARLGALAALPVERSGESTIQTGLDVAVPDALAWEVVSRAVDHFVAVPDAVVAPCVQMLAEELSPPIAAGESAVAGLGALVAAAAQPALRDALGLDSHSRVAVIICEGAFQKVSS